jgi:hypothetical protein
MPPAAIGISVKPADTGDGYTCKVPVNSLSEDGVAPEVGDSVDYSVKGTVKSVSGGQATVDIDSVNGEPVGEEASESPEEESTEEEGEEGTGGGPPGANAPPTSGAGGITPGLPAVAPGMPRRKRFSIPGLAGMGARLRQGARTNPMPMF